MGKRTVTVAETAGFCFGVKRAVNLVSAETEKSGEGIYTYGPIIHNEEVVRAFEEKGVRVVRDLAQLSHLPPGKIIIRSHGVSKAEQETMEASGFTVIDATCPFVKKIHRHAGEYSRKGYRIVVAGDRDHPEVQGIAGWGEKGEAPPTWKNCPFFRDRRYVFWPRRHLTTINFKN